jgi:hypothetical protein
MKMEATCTPETSVDSGLHGVISQKIVLFINTTVGTSKPECRCLPPAFTEVFCSAYFSDLKMEATCSSETSVDSGLHGVISQKMV